MCAGLAMVLHSTRVPCSSSDEIHTDSQTYPGLWFFNISLNQT
jgi:hypothetical protein